MVAWDGVIWCWEQLHHIEDRVELAQPGEEMQPISQWTYLLLHYKWSQMMVSQLVQGPCYGDV